MNKCPKCGGETKIVPEGVSKKTGKPYNAFIGCKNRECDYTAPMARKAQGGAVGGQNQGMGDSLEKLNTNLIFIRKQLDAIIELMQPKEEDYEPPTF